MRSAADASPARERQGTVRGTIGRKLAEPACKPGSVVGNHSSRRIVTDTLKQPTRTRRGQRHGVPIRSCSRWGLPCRPVTRLAVRPYRTISPLPRIPEDRSAVSFCCTFRRLAPPRRYLAPCPVEPGLSSALPKERRDCPADSAARIVRAGAGAAGITAEVRRTGFRFRRARRLSPRRLPPPRAEGGASPAPMPRSPPIHGLASTAVQRLARRAAQLGRELGGGGRRQVFVEPGVQSAAFCDLGFLIVGGPLHHHHELALALVVVGIDRRAQL